MRARSTLTPGQREALVDLFAAGNGVKGAAQRLGVGYQAVARLYDRWRLHGRLCLVEKPSKQSFSFETKKEVVDRFLAGETYMQLAVAFELSSPQLARTWVRQWRAGGDDALMPKPKGRPRGSAPPTPVTEADRLRAENQRLAAENAYLKKLRDLRNQGHA